jgi:group I intron endonuclease
MPGRTNKVYRITNSANGKVYIGQTINSVEDRLADHKTASRSGTGCLKLGRAIRKHGEEKFSVEKICEFRSVAYSDAVEAFLIISEIATVNGYNIAPGGKGAGMDPDSIEKQKKTTSSAEYKNKQASLIRAAWASGKFDKHFNRLSDRDVEYAIAESESGRSVRSVARELDRPNECLRGAIRRYREAAARRAAGIVDEPRIFSESVANRKSPESLGGRATNGRATPVASTFKRKDRKRQNKRRDSRREFSNRSSKELRAFRKNLRFALGLKE